MSTRDTNQKAIEKITVGDDFSSGGTLAPEEFQQFFKEVREATEVLNQARSIPVSAPESDIPLMGVGSRIMQGVSEGESGTKQTVDQPSVPYKCQKVSIPWEITWEASHETIGNAAESIRQTFRNQFAEDLEILASVGDESSSDAFESINDGWLTISQAASDSASYDHQADDGSGTMVDQPVDKTVFSGMIRKLPRRYREKQDLTFLMGYDQVQAYKEYLTDRSTAAGDAMLLDQETPSGYGYDILAPKGFPAGTALLTNMDNLAYIVEDNVRLKATTQSERNVMNDVEAILNLLAKVDYQVLETEGVCVGTGMKAP
jgi:hypothetical protein